jgi:hypothetical protein
MFVTLNDDNNRSKFQSSTKIPFAVEAEDFVPLTTKQMTQTTEVYVDTLSAVNSFAFNRRQLLTSMAAVSVCFLQLRWLLMLTPESRSLSTICDLEMVTGAKGKKRPFPP